MAKVYTKATATHQIPITVSFTCPKCRRAETVHKFAVIAGEATMRGYNNSMAGRAAENVLASSAEGQTADIEKRLRKGDIGMLCEEGKAMAFGKNIVCPECGLKQIPSAGGKKKTLWPKGFGLWLIPGYFVAATVSGRVANETAPFSLYRACGFTHPVIWHIVLEDRPGRAGRPLL